MPLLWTQTVIPLNKCAKTKNKKVRGAALIHVQVNLGIQSFFISLSIIFAARFPYSHSFSKLY